jgi:hypothetical protein
LGYFRLRWMQNIGHSCTVVVVHKHQIIKFHRSFCG